MTSNDPASEAEVISLEEDSSSDAIGHRPTDDIWSLFKKKKLPAEVAVRTHRNYDAVCKGCNATMVGKPAAMRSHMT